MDAIILQGVKTHNLKNVDLTLEHKKFYVITGVSGSGKSSLAFDTLYAEGQRRFVESLSSYARQFLERMERPDAESVAGIPPAIAIEAKNVITNARSTVGTQTEVNDYLRVLFSRIGDTFCPECNEIVLSSQPESVASHLINKYAESKIALLFDVPLSKSSNKYLKEFLPELERQGFVDFLHEGGIISAEELLEKKINDKVLTVCVDRLKPSVKSRKRLVDSLELAFQYGRGEIHVLVDQKKMLEFSERLRCFTCGKSFRDPTPNMFSFNSPLGACPQCQGFGRVITIDWDLVVPDQNKTLADGAIEPWTKPSSEWEFKQLLGFCKKKKIPTTKPWKGLSQTHRDWVLFGCKGVEYFSVQDFFKYLEKKTYKMHVRVFLAKYRGYVPCEECHETRLKPEGLWVKVRGRTIHDLQTLSLEDLGVFLDAIELTPAEKSRVEPVFLEITRRVRFLNEVGLGYISLSRLSRTLSGGEVQRIHLATSLGSALVDTLYVLDEPSIGLHERDNLLLIRLLKELRNLGNTVVVVEHDRAMMKAADELIDLGPMGGEKGGKILYQGEPAKITNPKITSLTGDYLGGRKEITRKVETVPKNTKWIKISGAKEHNLQGLEVSIPLKKFVVVSGVSGSGKSTFLYDVLYHHYLRFRGKPVQELAEVKSISGFEHIDDMVLIDQSPIGRTPRSNPATYMKVYDEIRKAFSKLRQSKLEGLEPKHFSFNVDGGRCDTCKGDGRVKVEMHFLADVYVPCEECEGKRFKPQVLDVTYHGKNIHDVLSMTIDEAGEFFTEEKKLVSKLVPLQRVGLGYLRLGQSATTLSGGEAQRLKLAYEMTERSAREMIYLFDEPTTGLHYHDIHFLMKAFEELLARGHSVVIIEHNMEVIQLADYVIDLGPEGGHLGGRLVYAGDVAGIEKVAASHTGRCLKEYKADTHKLMHQGV